MDRPDVEQQEVEEEQEKSEPQVHTLEVHDGIVGPGSDFTQGDNN